MDFLQRFSFPARNAIQKAREYCIRFENTFVEPEHILFAILNQKNSSAMKVLKNLEVNVAKMTYVLENYLYKSQGNYKHEQTFGRRTINLFDNAFKEINRFQQKEIRTIHLIIGMSVEKNTTIYFLFTEFNLDQTVLRNAYSKYLRTHEREEVLLQEYEKSSGEMRERTEKASEICSALDSFAFFARAEIETVDVLNLARKIAVEFESNVVTPGYILYAILKQESSSAKEVLESLGVDTEKLASKLAKLLEKSENIADDDPILDDRSQESLLRIYRACNRGGRQVKTIDILLEMAISKATLGHFLLSEAKLDREIIESEANKLALISHRDGESGADVDDADTIEAGDGTDEGDVKGKVAPDEPEDEYGSGGTADEGAEE